MYIVNLSVTNHPELNKWLSTLPNGLLSLRVRDRAEAVLQGIAVAPLPSPTAPNSEIVFSTGGRRKPEIFRCQIAVSKSFSPFLYDYIEFCEENGYRKATNVLMLLKGVLVPSTFVPFKWREGEVAAEAPSQSSIESIADTNKPSVPPNTNQEVQETGVPPTTPAQTRTFTRNPMGRS